MEIMERHFLNVCKYFVWERRTHRRRPRNGYICQYFNSLRAVTGAMHEAHDADRVIE